MKFGGRKSKIKDLTSTTFKTFGYFVYDSLDEKFFTFKVDAPNGKKKYGVLCTSSLNASKKEITKAITFVNNKPLRLVVISSSVTNQQLDHAKENDYALISMKELKSFNKQMLEAQAREH